MRHVFGRYRYTGGYLQQYLGHGSCEYGKVVGSAGKQPEADGDFAIPIGCDTECRPNELEIVAGFRRLLAAEDQHPDIFRFALFEADAYCAMSAGVAKRP